MNTIKAVSINIFPELEKCIDNLDCEITDQVTSEIIERIKKKIKENGKKLQNADVEDFLGW